MKERDNDLRIRSGRIRSTRIQRTRPIINQVLAATRKAGGHVTRKGTISSSSNSRFGRGKVASVVAMRGVSHRSRNVIIKARVVRQGRARGALAAHVNYLQRDGVTRDGEKGRLFGPEAEDLDRDVFADRCADDRHHFRFIVSPEDATQMADLKDFTRDLMVQMQKDLGTHLDWVAVEHWNTGQPHIHIIVRGVGDDGRDLVIARDYIGEGMRAQARNLVTQELGLRTDLDISRALERQIDVERWTDLDRRLARTFDRDGMIDMGVPVDDRPDDFHAQKLGRLRKLERLGLASEINPGAWVMHDDTEASLREMGSPGQVTDIALQAGEQLVGAGPVAAGDTVRWIIGDTTSGSGASSRVHILVKPTRADLVTNLVINTDRRTYHLEMRGNPSTYMASVSWIYPQDQLIALRGSNVAAVSSTPIATGIDVAALNFSYRIDGDNPPWRPLRIFDDGRQVFIEFPDTIAQGEMPPLFVIGAGGAGELVNYRVSGHHLIVDRLFAAAELRLGDKHSVQKVRIMRSGAKVRR